MNHFLSLTLLLRQNLNEWGYAWPRGIAANYNGNFKPLLNANAVNVVLGNSVLHHILEYETGLAHWGAVLDSPGIMIFGEPIKEGWVYWTSIVLSVLQAYNMNGLKLSSQTVNILLRHSKAITQRITNSGNRELLETLDDKHMFSPLKMMEVAGHLKMSLSIHKVKRNLFGLMVVRMKRIGISNDDIDTIMRYVKEIVPAGLEDTWMSDFAAFFVFKKG